MELMARLARPQTCVIPVDIEEVLRELYTEYVWPEDIPEGRDREIELIVGIYDMVNQQNLL